MARRLPKGWAVYQIVFAKADHGLAEMPTSRLASIKLPALEPASEPVLEPQTQRLGRELVPACKYALLCAGLLSSIFLKAWALSLVF